MLCASDFEIVVRSVVSFAVILGSMVMVQFCLGCEHEAGLLLLHDISKTVAAIHGMPTSVTAMFSSVVGLKLLHAADTRGMSESGRAKSEIHSRYMVARS
jgi:hypothetical protein